MNSPTINQARQITSYKHLLIEEEKGKKKAWSMAAVCGAAACWRHHRQGWHAHPPGPDGVGDDDQDGRRVWEL